MLSPNALSIGIVIAMAVVSSSTTKTTTATIFASASKNNIGGGIALFAFSPGGRVRHTCTRIHRRGIISLSTHSNNAPLHPTTKLFFGNNDDANNNNNNNSNNNNNEDVFLLSFDGTLASTTRSRSYMAICAALKVWPSLHSNMKELGMDSNDFSDWEDDDDDHDDDDDDEYSSNSNNEWLLQKLSALSSITQQGNTPDAMLGVDSVLLTRVLLEEQRLDEGRSNGRGGKYGGKFHPDGGTIEKRRSYVGSRPLTVGELYANWHELKDVTRTKYPFIEVVEEEEEEEEEEESGGRKIIRNKDPLPEIRRHLQHFFENNSSYSRDYDGETKKKYILPSWNSLSYDILFDYHNKLRRNTMLLLGHEAHIPWALSTLSSSFGCELDVEFDLEPVLPSNDDDDVVVTKDNVYHSCTSSNDGDVNDKEHAGSKGWNTKVIVTTSDRAKKYGMRQQERNKSVDNGEDNNGSSGGGITTTIQQPSLVVVVPNSEEDETHSEMIERIVHDFDNRNVYVAHSSLEVLKGCKSFLGDDAPILSQGLRKCILSSQSSNNNYDDTTSSSPSSSSVTLFLPEWADNVHPSEENDGEMDPWLNVAREEEFLELVSARIVVESSMV